MNPFHPYLILATTALLCASCGEPEPTSEPVVLTGELTIDKGSVGLMDCDLTFYPITGALRDSINARFGSAANLSNKTFLWLTVEATDSTYSEGSVVNVIKNSPCLVELPGTYAMEAEQDGLIAAKIHLDVSGRFSLAVAPGDGTRKDEIGDWMREKDVVILRGPERKYVLRIQHPDALVLEDSTMFGKVLLMKRR